jgi:hypothetical protein
MPSILNPEKVGVFEVLHQSEGLEGPVDLMFGDATTGAEATVIFIAIFRCYREDVV